MMEPKTIQARQQVQAHLRNVFLAGLSGPFVLRWLLNHLKYWGKLETEEDRIRHNVAAEIIEAGGFKLYELIQGPMEGQENDGRRSETGSGSAES